MLAQYLLIAATLSYTGFAAPLPAASQRDITRSTLEIDARDALPESYEPRQILEMIERALVDVSSTAADKRQIRGDVSDSPGAVLGEVKRQIRGDASDSSGAVFGEVKRQIRGDASDSPGAVFGEV